MDKDENHSIDFSLDEELWLDAVSCLKAQDGSSVPLASSCESGMAHDALIEQLWNMADGLLSVEESENVWEHVQKCVVCARELQLIQQAIIDSEMEKIYSLEEIEALLGQASTAGSAGRPGRRTDVLEMAIRFFRGKVELLRTTGLAIVDMGAVATRARTGTETPSASVGAAAVFRRCRVETRIESDGGRCHIEVRVLDPEGAQRPLDVDLALMDAHGDIIESASAIRGKHRFEELPHGDYSIEVLQAGNRIGQVQIKRE